MVTSGQHPAMMQQHAPQTSFVRAQLNLPGVQPGFQPNRTGPIMGVDLGTTNSCVALVENGRPRVIASREGYSTIPSIVAISDKGQILVGHPAKTQMITNPALTVYGSKRLVGRHYQSPIVEEVRNRTHYHVIPGPNGEAAVGLGNLAMTLEEVSALLLLEAKQLAEAHLGRSVHRAVITCPAFYNERQRQAVRTAGLLAGLYVERVVNEPTAAALAFGYGKGLVRRIAVFDLGGGTFDATVLELKRDTYEVLSTGGDTFLGGVDFDNLLTDYLLDTFENQTGVPFRGDRVALQRIIDAAEMAKKSLTDAERHRVHIPYITTMNNQPVDLDITVDRVTLEQLYQQLVERSVRVLDEVIRARHMTPGDIDDILLVGGMTRMPAVRIRLKRYFGKDPQKGVHPDEAVALGAALLANAIQQHEGVKLKDVLPMSIGVGLPQGRFKVVLPRNTPLPMTKKYTIPTTKDNQKSLELHVFQGEDETVDRCELLGTLAFDKLPKGGKGTVRVEVTFKLSEECILNLSAKELSTGRAMEASMTTKGTPMEVRRKLGMEERRIQGTSAGGRSRGFLAFLKKIFRIG